LVCSLHWFFIVNDHGLARLSMCPPQEEWALVVLQALVPGGTGALTNAFQPPL
jgi:hypothetical protein